jgi:hypothetical protein
MGRSALLAVWVLAVLGSPALAAAAPTNDDFAAAATVSGDHVEVAGSVEGATSEIGEPNHGGVSGGQSVWFRWTAPRSGLILVRCSSSFETVVAVYRGSSLAGLVEVGSDRGGPQCASPYLSFRATGGAEYRIAVDAKAGGGSGSFALMLDNEAAPAPPNDDFAHRAPMKDLGGNAFVFGTTAGAGREPGEPAHGGSTTGASVWFTWTAQRSGSTEVYPCHGDFHPVIDVYSGDSLTALSSLGGAGAGALLEPTCSLGGAPGTSFPAVAGQTYAISVDGSGGDWGAFELRLREAPLPRVPDPPDTLIRKEIKVHGNTAKILFAATRGREARYLCKLDRGPFRRCYSPWIYRGLRPGRHRFEAVAIALDEFRERDPTPAVRHFRIAKPGAGA